MSSGKNIEIRIATTGGQQAAAEIQKPTDAFRDQAEAANDLGDAHEDLARKNARALQGREEMLRGILEASRAMKGYGEAMAAAGPELDAVFGPENADTVRTFGETIASLSTATDLAAKGFAIGGPMGAALGGFVGLLSGPVKTELDAMVESMKDAYSAEAEYARLLEANQKRLEMGPAAYKEAVDAARNYQKQIEDLTVALADQQLVLESRLRIMGASDRADSAAMDRNDARRVANGEAPEDVAAERAKWDAEQEKRRVQAEVDVKKSAAESAKKLADEAFVGMNALANDPSGKSTAKEINDAVARFDKAEAAAKKLAQELETAFAIAAQKSREIDERTATKVEGQKERKTTRVLRENQDEVERGFAEEDRAEEQRSRQAKDRLKGNLSTAQDSLSDMATANEARIRKGGKTTGGLQNIAKDIGNADTEREIAALSAKISASQAQLGAATVAALNQMLANQAAMVKQMQTLRRQIKNNP